MKDTEGRTFDLACKDDTCTLAHKSNAAGEKPETWRPVHSGRLLRSCPPANVDGRDCRPLMCDGDRICARLAGETFTCLDGLCQDPNKPLTSEDRLALCLAETGGWSGSPEQRSRMALAMSCRPPCEVPAECRQVGH